MMRSRYNKSDPKMAGGFKRKSNYKVSADDDDDDEAPTSKRGKSGGSDFQPSTEPKTDSDGNKYWEISKARRVTVSEFKKKSMVNIREYYQADGNWLPGKKGISMTVEQYSALIAVMPQIESLLSQKGESVPRPNFGGAPQNGPGKGDEEDENADEEERKANIEATSDEEE